MRRGEPSLPITIAEEVATAVEGGQPVVALETTLVTHGFPIDEGLDLALELENLVRSEGATPATIGVLAGELVVGMTGAQLRQLAATPDVTKLNPANLAAGIVSGRPGSTTVAATLLAAQRAGIRLMATGGIGGVHRRVSQTGDISADLVTLSRCAVAVVCAGAKAVLDLPRTMEALETLGVPVYGHGTERLPAFYRRDSGIPLDQRFDSPADLVTALRLHFALGSGTGVVVANPIPVEHEMPEDLYEEALQNALRELDERQVHGRQVTPFLLARLRESTAGRSSFSNRALLRNNVGLAARLADRLGRVAA